MKIRASVLAPVIALTAVVALIGTGIAMEQSNQRDSTSLIDSTQGVAALDGGTPTTMQPEDLSASGELTTVQNAPTAGEAQRSTQGTAATSPSEEVDEDDTDEHDFEPSEDSHEEEYESDDD